MRAVELTPEIMVHAYSIGVFPMAESRDSDRVQWIEPRLRGILPLDRFHISRTLARRLRRGGYEITINRAFGQVVEACADRDETWINDGLFGVYDALHEAGIAHSLEVWDDQGMAGGVFGLAIGGAFMGESMFSGRTDGSKIALAYLTHRLRQGGFSLFDTQFLTPHLARLGGIEISHNSYRKQLAKALTLDADFLAPDLQPSSEAVIQRSTQTS